MSVSIVVVNGDKPAGTQFSHNILPSIKGLETELVLSVTTELASDDPLGEVIEALNTLRSNYVLVLHSDRNYSPNLWKSLEKWIKRYPENYCLGFAGGAVQDDPQSPRHLLHWRVTCNDKTFKPAPVAWLSHVNGVVYPRLSMPVNIVAAMEDMADKYNIADLPLATRWAFALEQWGLQKLVVKESNIRIARPACLLDAPAYINEAAVEPHIILAARSPPPLPQNQLALFFGWFLFMFGVLGLLGCVIKPQSC